MSPWWKYTRPFSLKLFFSVFLDRVWKANWDSSSVGHHMHLLNWLWKKHSSDLCEAWHNLSLQTELQDVGFLFGVFVLVLNAALISMYLSIKMLLQETFPHWGIPYHVVDQRTYFIGKNLQALIQKLGKVSHSLLFSEQLTNVDLQMTAFKPWDWSQLLSLFLKHVVLTDFTFNGKLLLLPSTPRDLLNSFVKDQKSNSWQNFKAC